MNEAFTFLRDFFGLNLNESGQLCKSKN